MQRGYQELFIDVGHGIHIAVRDYPSNGRPLVLLHGAGLNLALWDAVADVLAHRYHLVALDFLGHGASSVPEGFTLEADLAALERVIAELGLFRPAVIGHSYGGMLAVRYAVDHPECPIVINIDGHGDGQAEHYAGKTPEEVGRFWTQQYEALLAYLDGEDSGSHELRETHLARMGAYAEAHGVAPETISALAKRSIQRDRRGGWNRRPGADLSVDMYRQLSRLDMFGLYLKVRCPVVLVLALKPPLIPEPDADFIRAHRAGIDKAFTEMAATMPNLRLLRTDARHLMPMERPHELCQLIVDCYP
ncbi:alpha/beta fold hydrolase [Nonomuraea sp. NPDC049028]|uniref:alpha/beta fold hydrolase n=1 Tax=Nonomuraea sp. NPDC049028 TaxID=3364348 RepID=UPI00372004F6